jgi:methylated-DNA-[protein]-cysteine S-methyltransferase
MKGPEVSPAILDKLQAALNDRTITNFQFKVYSALLEVPAGKVTTYGEIGKKIQCNSSQAIGQALKKNDFAPDVPCHRVMRADLSLGGFSGSTGNETVGKKVKLLESEGIDFFRVSKSSEDSELQIKHDFLFKFQ